MNLPKDNKKEILHNIICLILVLILYYAATWSTGCPIRYILGISCPGCGMTRAWLAVLRLDFAAAFSYHPLFLLGPLAIMIIIFHPWIDFKKWRWVGILLILLFIIVYLLRLFIFPDHIVNSNFTNGLIYNIWSIFSNGILG